MSATKTKPAKAKAPKAPKAAKPAGEAKPKKATAKKKPKPKKMGALDAAAKVLAETGEPLNTREMVELMASKGNWKSPGGKTPHATLYSAILRELNAKGKDARFNKTERGKFTVNV